MTRRQRLKRIVQFFLVITFVAIVGLLLTADSDDFAALSYPPFPEEEYPFVREAIKHCQLESVGAPMESLVAGVAFVESRFRKDNSIVSSAGAVGRMQLLRPTLSGVGVKYQIPGINAQTAGDIRISYLGGTCYMHYLMGQIAGDGSDPTNWADVRKREAVYIGYNAGPARGKSYLAGNYNGPLSSLGYAKKVEQAARVYEFDMARLREREKQQQQNIPVAEQLSNQIRNLIWGVLLNSGTTVDNESTP